jgi:energy-coupling factor transporter transmembrane protein EcfT
MSIESITGLLEDFDPAALLPELDTVIGRVEFFTRLAVMAGPLVLLVLGVLYFFAAPREANYHFGYRCYFGMGSVQAWQFTQRIAGIVFAALGLILTVVMLIVCAGFRGQPMPDMIGSGITALIWQIVLAALAVVGINVTIAVLFDRQGERRKKAESQPENDTNV